MRFYYPSIFSLIFIAVLYAIVLGVFWFIWVKLYKRKFSGPAVWPVVTLVLVLPWLEEFWIAWNFGQLCRKDAGIVINRTVEVEGYFNDTGRTITRIVGGPSYKFIESREERKFREGRKFRRVEKASDEEKEHAIAWFIETYPGKELKKNRNEWIMHPVDEQVQINVEVDTGYAWRVTKLDRPTARYHYKVLNRHTPVAHQITRFENVVEDVQTGEILGKFVNYYRGAYWFFIHLSRPTIPCVETESDVRKYGTLSIYALTLKPIK
ncbi:MAG: hypothetical protein KIT13_03595 [Burkholderiales bacterium]|nr:hypothetical protein [Burkholderiales bacterium]